MSVIAEAQRKGGNAVFVDVEHALDPRYAKIVGVDLDNLMVSQPESGEDALNITETLIRSGAIDVIVVDSVAALVSRQELDGQMGDTTVGLQARNDESGNASSNCCHIQDQLRLYIHQSNKGKNWGHVWKPRNYPWR